MFALSCKEGQFFVIAGSFEDFENDWDIFESPLEFQTKFRQVD